MCLGFCIAQDATTASSAAAASGTQIPVFTMPTADPLVRGQEFDVSWVNAGASVQLFLIGKILNSNAEATSETEIGNEATNLSPVKYTVNASLPLGPYFFTIVDVSDPESVKRAFSEQYVMVDPSSSSTSSTATSTAASSSASSAASTTSTSSASTTAGVPASSGTSPSSKTTTKDALSPGAIAGIGIGAAALALVVLGLIIWLIMRRRRNSKATKSEEQVISGDEYTAKSKEGYLKPELDGSTMTSRSEMDGNTTKLELDGKQSHKREPVAELEATPVDAVPQDIDGPRRFELEDSRPVETG